MAEMKSFVLYRDYRKHFCKLSDEEAGKLIKAVFAYIDGERPENLSDRADMAFGFIVEQLDMDAEKWEQTKEKRRIAGKKGGFQKSANRANSLTEDGNAENVPEDAGNAANGLANASNATNSLANASNATNALANPSNATNALANLAIDVDVAKDVAVDVDKDVAVDEAVREQPPAPVQPVRRAYGEYRNVMLTETERQKLAAELPETDQYYIERLSEYIAQTGKQYQSHLATIRKWAKRDREEGRRICPAASPPAGQGARAWGVTFE